MLLDTATLLLKLALWPGLDAVFRRRLKHFRDDPNALASEISARFTEQVRTLDLNRVTRIAATVLRNIDRDIERMLQARWAENDRCEPLDDVQQAGPSAPHLIAEQTPDHDYNYHELAALLATIVPKDAGLVLDVAVGGFTQRDASLRHGLSHDATRKRYRRALAKVRAHLVC